MFACKHYDIEPDIICLAKGIANGEHLGITVIRKEICWPEGGLYSNTWGGDPRSAKAALTAIDIIESEGLDVVAVLRGTTFHDSFSAEIYKALRKTRLNTTVWRASDEKFIKFTSLQISHRIIVNFGGVGLMRRIKFEDILGNPLPELRNAVKAEARKRHILLMPCGDSAIRVMPPLVISEEETKWLARELADACRGNE